jgi:hypothetical protein
MAAYLWFMYSAEAMERNIASFTRWSSAALI